MCHRFAAGNAAGDPFPVTPFRFRRLVGIPSRKDSIRTFRSFVPGTIGEEAGDHDQGGATDHVRKRARRESAAKAECLRAEEQSTQERGAPPVTMTRASTDAVWHWDLAAAARERPFGARAGPSVPSTCSMRLTQKNP